MKKIRQNTKIQKYKNTKIQKYKKMYLTYFFIVHQKSKNPPKKIEVNDHES